MAELGDTSDLTLEPGEGSSAPEPDEAEPQAPAPQGPLLDEPDKKKVKNAILKNWKDQDRGLSYQLCEVEQAEFWRSGERWVFIKPADDDQQHEIWRPSGIERLGKMPDKVDQLVRRLTAQLLVDKPALEAEPENGTEAYQQNARLATRIFDAEAGVQGWDFRSIMEGALDIASTVKSAFAHVLVDPVGGGEQCVTVLASPVATHYDPANPDACLMEPGPLPPPQPGMPPGPPQPPPMVRTANEVTRFLNQDQSLTERETAQTIKRWVPWPAIKLLGFRNVRFLPEWCRGDQDADGLLVADYLSIGFLKQLYPDTVGQMDDGELRRMVAWKPLPNSQLLPSFTRDPQKIGTRLTQDVVPDDAIALVIWEYHRQSPVYPKGAAVCIGGVDEPIASGTLEVPVEQPDGSQVPRVLAPPVAQCRCITDWMGMRPHGTALVTKLGPWAELMGQQWSAVMDWLDRWNHPHQFLPLGSSVQPGQMANRTGEPILTNPNGEPHTELVPPIPADVKEFLDRAAMGMDKEALLDETAQGLEAPNVQSGVQAKFTVNQALVALSSIQQNATNFLITLGNILLERLQAVVTIPRAVAYVGDDGAYKADEWRNVNLTGVKGLRLKRGTFTMLSQDAKKQLLLQDVANHVIPMEDAIDQMAENTRTTFGLEDDPVRQRIRRQIHACVHAGTPFERLPVDTIPAVAHTRFRELAKTVMGTAWLGDAAKNPRVKPLLFAELEAMRQAAGVFTLAEQAQQGQGAQKAASDLQVQTETQIAAGKAKADSAKSEAEVLRELRSDIILLATKAGLDPKVMSAAASELEVGVLAQDAQALGIIHPAPVPPVVAPVAPPVSRLAMPRGGNGGGSPLGTGVPLHTPSQIVPRPMAPVVVGG